MKTKFMLFSIIISVFMLVLMLAGCIQNDIGVKLNKDGTGSVSATLGIEKEFYTQLVDGDSDPFAGKEVTEYEYEGSTYVAYTEKTKYDSYEEIEDALLDMTYETQLVEDAQGSTEEPANDGLVKGENEGNDNHIFESIEIKKNTGIFYNVYSFKAVLNPQKNTDDYSINDVFRVTLSVELPDEVDYQNGGVTDGNTVTYEIKDITQSVEYSAMCESYNYGVIIGIVVFLIIAFGIFIFIIKRKG